MSSEIGLTANQKTTLMWVTILLGLIMIGFAIIITINHLNRLPPTPSLKMEAGTSQEMKDKEISNYNSLASEIKSQYSTTYDFVVIKTLLPILTTLIAAVVAYVFAREASHVLRTYFIRKNSPSKSP